ncbi:hypothetical protein SRABI106_01830 [Rahnella aquatilis]|nr:hypothetical protein SRABI106_01830 [Rahnella aquatilis]
MRDFRDTVTDFGVHLIHVNAPGIGEFRANFRISDGLIAREFIRQHAHITGTLHIILTAYRSDADVGAAKITGQQSQPCQTFYHVNRLTKLGDAHAPHDGG